MRSYYAGCLIRIRSDVNFSIRIKSSAARELSLVRKQDRARIVAAIDRLADNLSITGSLLPDITGAFAKSLLKSQRLPN